MPGGKGFTAMFIAQSGGTYPWAQVNERGSIALSFEEVYAKAHDAEYWINPGAAKSIDELIKLDPRFSDFPCIKNGNLYTNDARSTNAGGSDFWESGIVYPQRVLKDLVRILHPELLPEHELFYYRKLPMK